MISFGFAAGMAAYLSSLFGVVWLSWALNDVFLPRSARLGMRLMSLIATALALVSIVVQSLGLLGALRAENYWLLLVAPALAGIWWWRRQGRLAAFFRLGEHSFRWWIRAPGYGLGWAGAIGLLYLAKRRFFLPRDIDSLTLHGPMAIDWVESARVSLSSFWNYPQCWEYQFVPSFLLLRSDALVAIPGLVGVVAVVLAVRELAARLHLGGRTSYFLAMLVGTLPVLWRDPLKNDPIFGFALLFGLLAIDRVARGLRGGLWQLQLAVFVALGTKPSGFLYAGLLVLAGALVYRFAGPTRRASPLATAGGWLSMLLLVATASAVQVHNFWVSGSPFYPVRFALFGRVVFDGPGNLAGTAVLERILQLETWRQLLLGGGLMVGAEWPLLMLVGLVALAASGRDFFRWWTVRDGRWPPRLFARALPWVAGLLWFLFAATPWSCGRSSADWDYLATGVSLRYAIAPIALLYLIALAYARRVLPPGLPFRLLVVAGPLLVFWKWNLPEFVGESPLQLWKLVVPVAVVAGLDLAWRRWRPAGLRWPGRMLAALALVALSGCWAWWVERTRDAAWLPRYREIWTYVRYQLPPHCRIGVSEAWAPYRYVLYGQDFANQLVVVSESAAAAGQVPDALAAYYLVSLQGEAQRQEQLAGLARQGWQVVAVSKDRWGTLLVRPAGAP